jgi:NADPH:quinone reductase-like Zn-dependent oxidoreductase
VRSFGADHVVDYSREDFTKALGTYDLMIDIVRDRSRRECSRILKPEATLVLVGGPKTNRLIGPLGHIVRLRLSAARDPGQDVITN